MADKFPRQARIAIIGGGVVGASLAHHLGERQTDGVVLLEQSELSAGTTWGSSALLSYFTGSPFATRLHLETIALYKRVMAETGQSTGYHETGSIRLAETEDRFLEYIRAAAMVRHFGVHCEVIDTARLRDIYPLLNTTGLLGAAYTKADGYVDPSSVTQALAQSARQAGVRILRQAKVRGLVRGERGWEVTTDRGSLSADVVVNAAGMWAPEIGRMIGAYHPVIAFERQYFVTEDIQGLHGMKPLPVLRDPEGTFYARPEVGGLLIGPYERQPRFWGLRGIPEGFAQESLPGYLDDAQEPLEAAMFRIPALNNAGIRTTVNVPTSRTPDANPLVGPVSNVADYYVAAGFFGGISQASVCRYLADWILDGEPGVDLSTFDPRRFDSDLTQRFAVDRIRMRHVIGLVQAVGFPREQPTGQRPLKTSAIYDVQAAAGAVFGSRSGWEIPLWFASPGTAAQHELTFRRPSSHDQIAAECRTASQAVGLADRSARTKISVAGCGAEELIARLFANRVPAPGTSLLSPVLTGRGKILSLTELNRVDENNFYVSARIEDRGILVDWIRRNAGNEVIVEDLTETMATLQLVGPGAMTLMMELTECNGRLESFQPLSVDRMPVGYTRCIVMRSSHTGLDSWEVHCSPATQRGLYGLFLSEGQSHGIAPVGNRAIQSLEYDAGHLESYSGMTCAEAGLRHLVDSARNGFVGRHGVEQTPPRLLKMLEVEANDADVLGGEPIFADERSVSLAICGGFGHRSNRSLAFAILPAQACQSGSLEVEIIGERRPARIVTPPHSLERVSGRHRHTVET